MNLKSSAFGHNGEIPSLYTCDGWNISPPLDIMDVPSTAQSLVLVVEDQDAPGGVWDHWIVFNIDPSVKEISTGEQPSGVAGKGSSDNATYIGPCPPNGTHRYLFTVYALDKILNLPAGSKKDEIMKAMEGHVIDKAVLIGIYTRWQKSA